MKKNYFIAVLISTISLTVRAESPCRVSLVINGVNQYWGYSNFTATINPGDTLICSVATGSPCGICTVDSSATYWIYHGITTHVVTMAVTDTGIYTLYAQSNNSPTCVNDFNTIYLTVNYLPTSAAELTAANDILISATSMDGIFKINGTDKNFEQLIVTDCMGKIVFRTHNNFSEINLSHVSPGIYFYVITDEKNKVWRGRIVKG